MMTLKGVIHEREAPLLIATYEVEHQNDGPSGTTLTLPIHLIVGRTGVVAAVDISGPLVATTDEALDALAGWLERLSAGIRSRGKSTVQIPTFDVSR
jgi:hypothetical protein